MSVKVKQELNGSFIWFSNPKVRGNRRQHARPSTCLLHDEVGCDALNVQRILMSIVGLNMRKVQDKTCVK